MKLVSSLFTTVSVAVGLCAAACTLSVPGLPTNSDGGTTVTTTVTGAGTDSGTSDPGVDGGTSSNEDAGKTSSGTDSGTTSTGTCPSAVDPSSLPTWMPPVIAPAATPACSAADLTAFDNEVAITGVTYTQVYNALSPACRTCAFSSESDTHWQVFVWSPNMAAGTALLNPGSCFAAAPGGNSACGQTSENFELCAETACPASCTDQTTCTQAAASGTCLNEGNQAQTACNGNYSTIAAACNTSSQMLKIVCGQ